jgi:dethiobiotin synthetase
MGERSTWCLYLAHLLTSLSQASSTGQLNTILTFYEITSPPLESQLTDLPLTLLRRAIGHLQKTGRAQIIEAADGGGVRLFAAAAARGS